MFPRTIRMEGKIEDKTGGDAMDIDPIVNLDCYPYTFTPLLLFSDAYFDRGYSNYNAVAQFFQSVIPTDMLQNVLYEQKNMLYEELLDYIVKNKSLVICCIDAHFTAFQVLGTGRPSCLYYDPLQASLSYIPHESFNTFAIFKLMKCHYGDSQHINENKDHYTNPLQGNSVRKQIYNTWKHINMTTNQVPYRIQQKSIPLNLKKYVLINDVGNPRSMSVQLTGCTCYFQVFLFAILCKIGEPSLARSDRSVVQIENADKLEEVTVAMSKHLMQFFVVGETLRPLTNSNVVIDFFRHRSSSYYKKFSNYLRLKSVDIAAYETQYEKLMEYFVTSRLLHKYDKSTLEGATPSQTNSKSLQQVKASDGAEFKLARADYYKYRAANLMFGFNANIMASLDNFSEFNALRKNQLLRYYAELEGSLSGCMEALQSVSTSNLYREYYFMPQFEVGQRELVDIHHYTYLIDLHELEDVDPALVRRIHDVNHRLLLDTFFSTSKPGNYDKMLSTNDFRRMKKLFKLFLESFMTIYWHQIFVGLGFAEIEPREKEINSLTQTVFYETRFMAAQQNRQSYEFEKECINQMARSTFRRSGRRLDGDADKDQRCEVSVRIGVGFTYSKYNTLMHFLSVVEQYWRNPDLSNVQVFGKDIRVLLAISSQKVFFDKKHSGFYHYGPLSVDISNPKGLDLAVGDPVGVIMPTVRRKKRKNLNRLLLVDRVYEFHYLKNLLSGVFRRANSTRFKTDNEVLNLCLLSLMLDFGLFEQYVSLLHLPFLRCLQHQGDTRELQVEIANLIYELDRKNTSSPITRAHVEELLFETSYNFLVNKGFNVRSKQFKLIQTLNSDPDYQRYVLLCKIYMSLCQINRSTEADYYKVHCYGSDLEAHTEGEFRIIIPQNYSKATSKYLEEITKRYTFSEVDGMVVYDDHQVFDLRPQQPEINLHRVRFESSSSVQSMVKYMEITNVFRVEGIGEQYLIFMADNVLQVKVEAGGKMRLQINKIEVEVATIFFNEAISFVPCFKYAESEDVVLFTSPHMLYMVDKGGQFATDYYGMKNELMEFIKSDEVFVDLNDEHVFKEFTLTELLTESKTVLYYPDYLLQVSSRQQLIDLLDLAIKLRNISFFILVLFYLRRSSVSMKFVGNEHKVVKITGPWKAAILYVLNNRTQQNDHYDEVFQRQFFDLNQHKDLPLEDFIDILCDNFTKYQQLGDDGRYRIVPRQKQKEFLRHLVSSEEPFHFSEVGSGKTKVILPLLCQMFLSNNEAAHKCLARGGKRKDVLIILVPEHLVSDARTQVYRYCLNLNFREEYRVYDDIFVLLHASLNFGTDRKQIFVTSFNQFKKALTYDAICAKMRPHREKVLIVADEVDDFLERNKLVFNICSNKANDFDQLTVGLYFDSCEKAYKNVVYQEDLAVTAKNPDYWRRLHAKFLAIHAEIQDASRSINRSFGIFNPHTLKHCTTNIMHDIEGYKSLIARPYESVNRAMPGSYYSDVERTIFLTYVILSEDISKYNELFQSERKFITFDYWNSYFIHYLDFDDLVYGHESLEELVERYPDTRDGLIRFLFGIILRRMEIRDKSRSVNSIDVVFNFDCIGFTGTPFLDNYPTFDYIRHGREDAIPDLIDRRFYAYSNENLSQAVFEERFSQFQGRNDSVTMKYVNSDFIRQSPSEMATLEKLFEMEESVAHSNGKKYESTAFNAIVDLCGIFKQSDIHDVRNLIKRHFGPDRFHFVYHIDQRDSSDRVLYMNSDNDVQYDEEFYKYACKTYGEGMRHRIFFFVDNRNVIGKDIPFQLVYQQQFGKALFTRMAVIAHDVEDFSKIWQAMGRSRTMNETVFSVYKSDMMEETSQGFRDIKEHQQTKNLYTRNCDCKIAGNISSIYLTLIALHNLSQRSFYYCDRIVNVFLEKMQNTLSSKVETHEKQLVESVLDNAVPAHILLHMVVGKFQKSSLESVASFDVNLEKVEVLLRHVVRQKYELRAPSGDVYDDLVMYLSGEQQSLMEISYTKQQQKQKQTQKSKDQDSDTMGIFDRQNQLIIAPVKDNYYESSRATDDATKILLHQPSHVPILSVEWEMGGRKRTINVYPTLQFLYSHHIDGEYITDDVKQAFHVSNFRSAAGYGTLLRRAETLKSIETGTEAAISNNPSDDMKFQVLVNFVRQSPLYTIAGVSPGMYIIGMKDQFNGMDIQFSPLKDAIQYVADDMGFILFDRTNTKRVDDFGPYYIEQYILMHILSKSEVAQNVIDYYCKRKDLLDQGVDSYSEAQGKGFVCWRFLMNEAAKTIATSESGMHQNGKSS